MNERFMDEGRSMSLELKLFGDLAPPIISNLARVKNQSIKRKDLETMTKEFFDRQREDYEPYRTHFIERVNEDPAEFISFVESIEHGWSSYLNLVYFLDAISEDLDNRYPLKIEVLERMLKGIYDLNQYLWFATDIEKEIYGNYIQQLEPKRRIQLLDSIRSLPVFLGENLGEVKDTPINKYSIRKLIREDRKARQLMEYCGWAQELFKETIKGVRRKANPKPRTDFTPENEVEENLQKILAYDHFIELFLRKSGMLKLDLNFYNLLSKKLCIAPGFDNLIKGLQLERERRNQRTRFKIPFYQQRHLSCGAVCLLNVAGCFGISPVNEDTELEILKEVTVPGFMNNLPTSLVRIARERYGIDAKFFVNMGDFRERFINNPEMRDFPPLKKFMQDYSFAPIEDISGFTTEDLKKRLSGGRMLACVGDQGDYLHYRLIYGFETKHGRCYFNLFDPQSGPFRADEEQTLGLTRNKEGFWGVEYPAPEISLFPDIESQIKSAREVLKWKEKIFSTKKM